MLTRLQRPLAKMDRMKAAEAKNDGPKQPMPDLDALSASSQIMGKRYVRRMQQGQEFSSVPAWNENTISNTQNVFSLSAGRKPACESKQQGEENTEELTALAFSRQLRVGSYEQLISKFVFPCWRCMPDAINQ